VIVAIIDIKESWSGMVSGGTDSRTQTRVLTVLCDRPMTTTQIAFSPGIPRWGEAHPEDGWLRAQIPGIKPLAPWYFEVTITYVIPGGSQGEDNPLNIPPDRRWGFVECTEPIDEDLDGKPIVNSAGDTFDPPPTDDFYDPLYTITRNEAAFGPAVALMYNDAINADPFMGAPAGSAWLRVESEEVQTKKLVYWRTIYSVQFRVNERDKAGWKLRMLNQGYNSKFQTGSNDTEVRPVMDKKTNTPISHPVLLDAKGQRILPEQLAGGTKAVWLMFKRKRAVPFGPLHLV
jgi:hypothetical protein